MLNPIELATSVHAKLVSHEVDRKYIAVELYPLLAAEVPDTEIVIDEILPLEELEVIGQRFEPYLGEDEIFPILGTLGGNVVGIGYSTSNQGAIYYYDFDFGLFRMTDSIDDFLTHLRKRS